MSKTWMRSLAAAVIALTMFGCGDEEADVTEQQEVAEAAAQEVAQEAAQEAARAAQEAAEAVEAVEAAEQVPEGLEAMAAALEGATAAAAAGEGEGTHCEQALAGILAMRAQLEESMGGNNNAAPIDEANFMANCNALPAGAQQCMVMSYAMGHRAECAAYQEQIRAAAPQPGN